MYAKPGKTNTVFFCVRNVLVMPLWSWQFQILSAVFLPRSDVGFTPSISFLDHPSETSAPLTKQLV
jgi:hypothetical protein